MCGTTFQPFDFADYKPIFAKQTKTQNSRKAEIFTFFDDFSLNVPGIQVAQSLRVYQTADTDELGSMLVDSTISVSQMCADYNIQVRLQKA